MLNVVKMSPGDVAGPKTGRMRPAREVLVGYTRMFLPALFARGGYPAIAAHRVGGYLDTWGVEPDPGWTMAAFVRYRSRCDLVKLVMNPRFAGAHEFKLAAMPNTFNFPTRPIVLTLMSPRIWVGPVIALAAALIQIAILL